MKNSFLIWVPSKQKYIRFWEMKLKHLKYIEKAKNISNIEFLFATNKLLEKLIYNKDELVISHLTLIDKYTIYLYLRMLSVGTKISCTITCPDCEEETKTTINLNELILPIKDTIDRIYEKRIKSNDITFICDIPSIQQEYELEKWINENEINLDDQRNVADNYLIQIISYIKGLVINDINVDLIDIPLENKMSIIKNIPSSFINKVQEEYVSYIKGMFLKSKIIKHKCSNKKCRNNDTIFNLKTINEIIKFILSTNMEEYLEKMLYLCKWNYNPEYLDNIPLAEIEMLLSVIENIDKKTSPQQKQEEPLPKIAPNTEFETF